MRLDQAIIARGLCGSRTEAQELIQGGHVHVNGVIVTKQIKEVQDSDSIILTRHRAFVSRGGEKLQGALLHVFGKENVLHTSLDGAQGIDIGSSTGGFTDCLLHYGIQHVDAIDVGTSQLHSKLREDARVSLFENTDIRDFASPTPYDIVVADLSFISLEAVFEKIISFGQKGSRYFMLLKPQFEVGKGNTKKGIVKNESLVSTLLIKYEALAATTLEKVELFPCSIKGGDGNQEYFLTGVKK